MSLVIKGGGIRPPDYTDRRQSPLNFIFRATNYKSFVERLKAAGVQLFGERDLISGSLAYFLDPAGYVVGVQERRRTSPRSIDAEAFRRLDAGETTIPGVDPLPADLQNMGWLTRWVSNAERSLHFYQNQIGIPYANEVMSGTGAMLNLGDTTAYEVKDLGTAEVTEPWNTVSNAFIMRVRDVEGFSAWLEDQGVAVAGRETVPGGRIAWVLDPDGLPIGLQQRDAESDRPEDVEARRRFT